MILASADAALRQRLESSLSSMRWLVREAGGGADAMVQMEEQLPEVLVMDSWLPDLEVGEFARQVRRLYPGVDLLRMDGVPSDGGPRSPRQHELLHALREAQQTSAGPESVVVPKPVDEIRSAAPGAVREAPSVVERRDGCGGRRRGDAADPVEAFAEMIGRSAPMLELARLIKLVAPTSASVLIEGETGTGKEVVANAVYRLSTRQGKPFIVLNCAAIPEALLEAELFGHTRGAFTGAVQARTGRIESANGGTLFLDEIGEMPLALQAKMLRFLECGELQRIGDNEMMRVDVRVVAATHRDLGKNATDGKFRLDLYHRLAVFPLEVPALRARMEDLPLLAEHLLAEMGRSAPRKRLTAAALERLEEHNWPGNVRELRHVLLRGTILAGDAPEIQSKEIRYRRAI